MIILFAVATALYFFVDPTLSKWMPKCVFHAITGWECPGCGSQRMIHALLHADLRQAWHYNPFLLCLMPLILFYVALDFFPTKFPRLFRIMHSTFMIAGLGVATLIWGILRNCLSIYTI